MRPYQALTKNDNIWPVSLKTFTWNTDHIICHWQPSRPNTAILTRSVWETDAKLFMIWVRESWDRCQLKLLMCWEVSKSVSHIEAASTLLLLFWKQNFSNKPRYIGQAEELAHIADSSSSRIYCFADRGNSSAMTILCWILLQATLTRPNSR